MVAELRVIRLWLYNNKYFWTQHFKNMTWNYRIMKKEITPDEFEYGVYEVYYDDDGNVKGYTENSLLPTCASEESLLFEIELMKEAFNKETLLYC